MRSRIRRALFRWIVQGSLNDHADQIATLQVLYNNLDARAIELSAVTNATLRTVKADIERLFAHYYDVRKDLEKPDTFWLRREHEDDHGSER